MDRQPGLKNSETHDRNHGTSLHLAERSRSAGGEKYVRRAGNSDLPGRGLEPLRIAPPDPKSGASANFATLARTGFILAQTLLKHHFGRFRFVRSLPPVIIRR